MGTRLNPTAPTHPLENHTATLADVRILLNDTLDTKFKSFAAQLQPNRVDHSLLYGNITSLAEKIKEDPQRQSLPFIRNCLDTEDFELFNAEPKNVAIINEYLTSVRRGNQQK